MQAFFEKIIPGDRHGGPTVCWVIGNTIVFYLISAGLLFVTMWIPALDTCNNTFSSTNFLLCRVRRFQKNILQRRHCIQYNLLPFKHSRLLCPDEWAWSHIRQHFKSKLRKKTSILQLAHAQSWLHSCDLFCAYFLHFFCNNGFEKSVQHII